MPPPLPTPPPVDYRDPSSASEPGRLYTRHVKLCLTIDMEESRLFGHATLEFSRHDPSASTIVLDARGLEISKIVNCDTDQQLSYSLWERSRVGSALSIQLDQPSCTSRIAIHYSTDGIGGGSPAGGACDWLNSSQTRDGNVFMFTQAQAIHARSILPCQDTPSVKFTFDAEMTLLEPYKHLTVVMGAVPIADDAAKPGVFRFVQDVPIPSYLIAFACGQLVCRQVSPRCSVWAEPSVVDDAKWEFEEMEQFLATAERLAGPYVWKIYHLLVLPTSFPYGGMENPCLTFLTPSLLSVRQFFCSHIYSGRCLRMC